VDAFAMFTSLEEMSHHMRITNLLLDIVWLIGILR
jgi:hypothetical protein